MLAYFKTQGRSYTIVMNSKTMQIYGRSQTLKGAYDKAASKIEEIWLLDCFDREVVELATARQTELKAVQQPPAIRKAAAFAVDALNRTTIDPAVHRIKTHQEELCDYYFPRLEAALTDAAEHYQNNADEYYKIALFLAEDEGQAIYKSSAYPRQSTNAVAHRTRHE